MTVCIPVQPEHTQHGKEEAQLSSSGRFVAIIPSNLPVLKLRNAEQQKY